MRLINMLLSVLAACAILGALYFIWTSGLLAEARQHGATDQYAPQLPEGR